MSALTVLAPPTPDVVEFLRGLRHELRFSGQLDRYIAEPVRFSVRDPEAPASVPNPAPHTACWAFRGVPGAHLIHFCLGLFSKVDPDTLLAPDFDWRGYVAAYAHHELMHACVTRRDLKAADDELKAAKVPFRLWNLFEDARIEARGRSEFGFPMKWLDYERVTPAAKPGAYFFNLIQNCGNDSPALLEDSSAPWVSRVRDHYFKKALTADRFSDMLALLKEWVTEFPEDRRESGGKKKRGDQRDGADGAVDLEGGLTLQLDGETFDALVSLAQEQADGKKPGAALSPSMGTRHSITPVPDSSDDPVIRDAAVREPNVELSRKVSERLAALLAPSARRERSIHHAKRISARALLAGRPDFYRRKVDGNPKRPVRITFFIDCSGSMGSTGPAGVTAADGGIAVAMGLNELARRGLVTGHMVLHKGDRRAKCATYAFPQPDDFFSRIPSDGYYEALEHAFGLTAEICRQSDYVFCYTDGHICDAAIDLVKLRAHGLRPIGLYCGDSELAEPLREWFASALIRPSVLELVEAIVATVDFSRTKRGGGTS